MHHRIILSYQSHFCGCPGHQAGRTSGEKRLDHRHSVELGGQPSTLAGGPLDPGCPSVRCADVLRPDQPRHGMRHRNDYFQEHCPTDGVWGRRQHAQHLSAAPVAAPIAASIAASTAAGKSLTTGRPGSIRVRARTRQRIQHPLDL